MISNDPRACAVFEKDVADTYKHLVERVRIASRTPSEPAEQIQLVPENPSHTISFNVPDGPPPDELQLEGPGLEGVTVEEVRKMLQMRWDVFKAFSQEMREALMSQSLDAVNTVLGKMAVKDAEEVVRLLDVAGILSFSEHGVKDTTNPPDSESDGEGDDADEEDEGDD